MLNRAIVNACRGAVAAALLLLPGLAFGASVELTQGKLHFAQYRYEAAIPALEAALKDSALAENEKVEAHELLAYCYAAMENHDLAVSHYKAILLLRPGYAPKDPATQPPKLAKAYQDAKAAMAATTATTTGRSPTKAQDSADWPFAVASLSVSAVGFALGGLYYDYASRNWEDLKDARTASEAKELRDRGKANQAMSQTGFAVGLVFGIGAIPMFFTGGSSSAALGQPTLAFVPDPEAPRVQLRVAW
jgi:tetratricopeptide (TPR) repeat protein